MSESGFTGCHDKYSHEVGDFFLLKLRSGPAEHFEERGGGNTPITLPPGSTTNTASKDGQLTPSGNPDIKELHMSATKQNSGDTIGYVGPEVVVRAPRGFKIDYQLKGGDLASQNGVKSSEAQRLENNISIPLDPSKWQIGNFKNFDSWKETEFNGGFVENAKQYDVLLENGTTKNVFELQIRVKAQTITGYDFKRYYFSYSENSQQWEQLLANPDTYQSTSAEKFCDAYGRFMHTALSIAFGLYLGAAVGAGEASVSAASEGMEYRATQELFRMQASNPKSHFVSRHGAGTTLMQQYIRSATGYTPDGEQISEVASSRVFSNRDMLSAIRQAELNGNSTMHVSFDKIVGEGFLKGGGAYKTTNIITVAFKNSKAWTAYPNINAK